MINHAEISIKQHILSEPFALKTPDGSTFTLIGIWNDEYSPNNFSAMVVTNDMPTIDFLTAESSTVKKKTEVTRNADSKKFYVIDIFPDDGGITTFKVSRNNPQ